MPSALAVAKCFFDFRRRDDGHEHSFVRIHKLVYFAHGLHMGTHEKPLIEEQLEAWQWGPIFPSLYYSLFGRNIPGVMATAPSIEDEDVCSFIERLEKALRGVSTLTLSAFAHQEGSPWYQVVTEKTGNKDVSVEYLRGHLPPGVVIEREAIRSYFKEIREQPRGREQTQ